MCAANEPESDVPPWLRSGLIWLWEYRSSVAAVVALAAVLAAVVGVRMYLAPTDVEEAEADIRKAVVVLGRLDAEARNNFDDSKFYRASAAEYRQNLIDLKGTTDEAWLARVVAFYQANLQLSHATRSRRDNLHFLIATYVRLCADAECEVLRAKDARDHGTPYKVAPRVREILAPVLAAQ